VKYYLTEGRAQFNPILHIVVPLIATAAGVVVVWKSYFSPWATSGVVYWGLLVFFVILAVTIAALIYMRVTHREEWMAKAQLVFEQSGTSH
jgi:large-conductance mechanosensitive channel